MKEFRAAQRWRSTTSRSNENGLELWQSIRTIYRAALKRLNARLEKERVTFSQYNVLLAISRNGPMAMSKLGDQMLVAPANVTGLVDRMESKGYVRRTRDRKDRRLWVVEMTPTGRKIFKGISSRFRQYTGGLGSELTREELESTLAALRKVRTKVEESSDL
jgi:DNA-binding MarR family transcriptional regulator